MSKTKIEWTDRNVELDRRLLGRLARHGRPRLVVANTDFRMFG